MIKVVDKSTMGKRPIRILVYGETGVGKSFFALGFPHPLIISNGRRDGDYTYRLFDGWNSIEVETDDDMAEAMKLILADQTKWDTIVLDTITYHADQAIEALTHNEGKTRLGDMAPMQQRDWGKLEMYFMRSLQPTLHRLNKHIVYLAMSKNTYIKGRDNQLPELSKVEPNIPGAARERLPGKCDVVGYMRRVPIANGNKVDYQPRMVVMPSDTIVARAPGLTDKEIVPSFDEFMKRFDWIERNPTTGVNGTTKATAPTVAQPA